MQEIEGIMRRMKHHHKLDITVNEDCKIELPQDILEKLLQPHKLSYYYFVFLDEGSETYEIDLQDVTINGSELVFGLPGQVFCNPDSDHHYSNYKIGFDESTLALLPTQFPFLLNSLNTNTITFGSEAKARVKSIFSNLFQLLHSEGKPKHSEIILAHLNTLLTEFNSAYFEHSNQAVAANPKLNKYIAFKLAVEEHLTEQQDVQTIAEQLTMTTSTLYSVVKEFSGVSPKEWMTGRLMLEAQRKLQYSNLSVKELAYELGFNDPDYFSRLFKKSTGKSITAFLAGQHD
ncbi:MAG: helix-turn-helix domain-containing protein [Sphingobacteriaceae bacterium]|nr:MAG: helix-turn-helix domain-containing protein [Sphingobacteriaceae bacterium]